MFSTSFPIDVKDTKQIDITVEDTYCVRSYGRHSRESWFVVVADSEKYWFEYHGSFDKYSVDQLYKSISKGDGLRLTYYETSYIVYGKVNVVVDARAEAEIYRSFESYNRARQGIPTLGVIIFSIIELVFVGIVFVNIWLNKSIFKEISRKIKCAKIKKQGKLMSSAFKNSN